MLLWPGCAGTVWRSDVPGVDEIIRLKKASRMHYSALPFLAGLDILQLETPERLEDLTESRRGQGWHSSTAAHQGFNGLPDWHRCGRLASRGRSRRGGPVPRDRNPPQRRLRRGARRHQPA